MSAYLISQTSKVRFRASVDFGTADLASNSLIRLQGARYKEKQIFMNPKFTINCLLVFLLVPAATFLGQEPATSPGQVRIQKEVRHELLMLPYFGVFDNI